ncbi:hypothetical protein FNV43_RR14763 [Rhamnella rubrinervis]|uniref:Uncharacterized protein n=1 Tax=Rhamnella rubrinervis TaxID=2594499 RepID=A0A8K0MGP1_9ROSA|nr:hypothetical protein FNV43_RR14763 [Rhamnella rubrinervis]
MLAQNFEAANYGGFDEESRLTMEEMMNDKGPAEMRLLQRRVNIFECVSHTCPNVDSPSIWSPRSSSTIKLNCDSAFQTHSGKGAVGIVVVFDAYLYDTDVLKAPVDLGQLLAIVIHEMLLIFCSKSYGSYPPIVKLLAHRA